MVATQNLYSPFHLMMIINILYGDRSWRYQQILHETFFVLAIVDMTSVQNF